ncbi:MAG: hypothetical protein ACREMY_10995, partial [bacterium]
MKGFRVLPLAAATIAALLLATLGGTAWAETDEVRIADQFGLSYLPVYVALDQELFRKRFEAAGLSGTK